MTNSWSKIKDFDNTWGKWANNEEKKGWDKLINQIILVIEIYLSSWWCNDSKVEKLEKRFCCFMGLEYQGLEPEEHYDPIAGMTCPVFNFKETFLYWEVKSARDEKSLATSLHRMFLVLEEENFFKPEIKTVVDFDIEAQTQKETDRVTILYEEIKQIGLLYQCFSILNQENSIIIYPYNCASLVPMSNPAPTPKDFFVSYTGEDRSWAEWIGWVLEEAGYTVIIQAWDFKVGGNFVLDMQRATIEARRTIAVLSSLYLEKPFPQPEWAAAFAQDPTSSERKLIPVRVENCKPPGLLAPIVYSDLFDCEETEAQQRLLSAVTDGRMKPAQRPRFPGKGPERVVPNHVPFPGTAENASHIHSPTSPSATGLTPWQQRQLEGRRDALLPEWERRSQKVKQIRAALAIEVGITVKFQLEQQLLEEETKLSQLSAELGEIEQKLSR